MPPSIKSLLKIFAGLSLIILLLMVASIAPIDRTPIEQQDFYKKSISAFNLLTVKRTSGKDSLKIGWANVNITPNYNMPMAGYRPRDHFDSINDSLFARVLVIDNGETKVALVTIDLLLFPPALKSKLSDALKDDVDFLYLSATHTHNSVGAFDNTIGGELISGSYDEEWIDFLNTKIQGALHNADSTKLNAVIAYGESNAQELVSNRLRSNGQTDGTIRSVQIEREDNSKGIFFTFSAHATSISKKSFILSADYPGEVIEKLKQHGVDFSMYMAGMVASHRVEYKMISMRGFPLMDTFSTQLTKRLINTQYSKPSGKTNISFADAPISFGDAQMRILKDWRLRPWLFNTLFHPLEGSLTYLSIGEVTFVGTPCDFSGELYLNYLKDYNKPLIITSFNGSYVGYITEDSAYNEINKSEVMIMNWVGPYHGQFMAELVEKLITKEE